MSSSAEALLYGILQLQKKIRDKGSLLDSYEKFRRFRKKINSELNTKINKSEIKHNQIYIETDKDDLIDICLFLKTNNDTKFRQLIDITVVDYPERTKDLIWFIYF